MSRKSKKSLVSICLYGNRQVGFDHLTQVDGGEIFGQPSPEVLRYGTLTEALVSARVDCRERGIYRARVEVFAPGGDLRAETELEDLFSFGALKWAQAAPAVVISVEALLGAAERN